MIKEFREFAFRGNMLDLAVGLILGTAFGVVVKSLAEDVIVNAVAAAIGQPDFGELTFAVGKGIIRYGSFLTAMLNFVLVALALFLVVKAVNRAMRPKGAEDKPAEFQECPHCLSNIPVKATRCSQCTSDVEPRAA